MSRTFHTPAIRLALVLALALGLTAGLTGCGKSGSSSSSSSSTASSTASTTSTTTLPAKTAKEALPLAVSALSTTMPDAKLLLVAAGQVVTPSTPPVWQYLFGSPKSGTTYAVIVENGKATTMKYGTANLAAAEWAAIPTTYAWKIDSDKAVAQAMTVYPGAKKSTAYILGFVTYIPKSDTKVRTPAMTWSVSFDPATKGKSATSTVDVSAVTGAAALAK
jgi:hypothetical protein